MEHHEFRIGMTFWCGDRPWRCTDVGTRVITAIELGPHRVVESGPDPENPSRTIRIEYMSNDPSWLNGPPYGVAEEVFDEYDQQGCLIKPDKEDEEVNVPTNSEPLSKIKESGVHVIEVSPHGIVLLLDGQCIRLDYSKLPWFKKATVEQIFNVLRPSPDHLYWPDLDIDLSVASIRDPKAFPLVAQPRT
jgi:Protein of unknown function (DUF2442)